MKPHGIVMFIYIALFIGFLINHSLAYGIAQALCHIEFWTEKYFFEWKVKTVIIEFTIVGKYFILISWICGGMYGPFF
jgi:hypothetical protein